jgi:hypothetical protein
MRLLAAPPSLPGESRLSWVQRLCGAHQYSIARLRDITGINPLVGDWDTGVSTSEWADLLSLAGMKADSCGEAIYCLDQLCTSFPRRQILLYDKQMPRCRWCSRCLSGDPVPYLRWDWRLMEVRHCSIHKVPLDDQCVWCGSSLQMHRTLLLSSPDLATCASCGMALVDREYGVRNEQKKNRSAKTLRLSSIDELLGRLKQGCQLEDNPLGLGFSRYADAVRSQPPKPCNPPKPKNWGALSWKHMIVGPARKRGDLSVAVISGHSSSPQKETLPRSKWSALLFPAQRVRLTQALLIIRAEKNAQRRQREKDEHPVDKRDVK